MTGSISRTKRTLLLILLFGMIFFFMQTAPAHADCKEPGAEVSPEEAACQSVPADRFITPDMLPNRYVEGDNGEPEVPSPRKVRPQTNGYTDAYIPTVVVVIGFDNMPYSNQINWNSAIFGTGDDTRSAKKYFHDMSYGKITFEPVTESSAYGIGDNTCVNDKENDGIIHVKMDSDISHMDWSSTSNLSNTAGPRMMARAFIQAVQKASAYVDFTQYDDNKNGELNEEELALVFVVAGYDSGVAEQTVAKYRYLRSHKWNIEGILEAHDFTDLSMPKVTRNGKTVTINPYVAVSEHIEWKKPDGSIIVLHGRTASLIHELGHHLGLPDLYDTTDEKGAWEQYNVGYLSIMGTGSWGRDDDGQSIAYSMDPWSKIRLGWNEPSVMNTPNRIYTASAQNYGTPRTKNTILKIPASQISSTGKEYYLIENRRFDEWDEGLPYRYSKTSVETSGNAGGLILWHIDEQVLDACASKDDRVGYYDINNTVHRPGIMPLTAEAIGSDFTFISDGSRVYHERPFFDKTIWDKKYKSYLGQELELPTYGGKAISSGPETRSLSGVRIEFIAAAGSTSVGIRYIGKGHVHTWEDSGKKNFSDNICEGGTYDEASTCTVCGQEKLVMWSVKPGTHLEAIPTPGSPAGCVYAGTLEYYTCKFCGKMFKDAACTKEITSSILIQPYGHDWETLYVTEPPGYDYEGTGYARCRRCGIEEFISLPHLDISDKMGDDGTALGTGASEEAADKNLISYSAEKDPAGSRFSKLKLKSSYQTKTSIKLTWSSAGASKYVVYGSKCGAGNKLKKITDTSAKSISVSKIDGVKLKKSSYYKFVVVAVDADGNVISSSKQIHIATKGTKKKSNPSSVSVSSTIKKKAARLKKSKSLKLSAKVKCKKGCKYSKHVGLRYESSDPSIVTVSSKGVIKGKSKGTAKVYAYAQNGASKTITVKIK